MLDKKKSCLSSEKDIDDWSPEDLNEDEDCLRSPTPEPAVTPSDTESGVSLTSNVDESSDFSVVSRLDTGRKQAKASSEENEETSRSCCPTPVINGEGPTTQDYD